MATPPRLRDQRRRSRRRLLLLLGILVLVLCGTVIYGLWQPSVRISSITVTGGDSTLAEYARQAMQGSYLGIVPRNSTFFIPMHRIRAATLAVHSDIAALSISRQGLTGLSIRVSMRTAVGHWCGSAYSSDSESTTDCYLFDPNGFVYMEASSTATMPIHIFALYSPLAGDASKPLGAMLADAALLPDTFAFARQFAGLGSPADAVVIRGDEVDILLASGTRVTYVLGHEQDAYTALQSARASFNLANGSVDYIDLRFPGKVYLKKRQND